MFFKRSLLIICAYFIFVFCAPNNGKREKRSPQNMWWSSQQPNHKSEADGNQIVIWKSMAYEIPTTFDFTEYKNTNNNGESKSETAPILNNEGWSEINNRESTPPPYEERSNTPSPNYAVIQSNFPSYKEASSSYFSPQYKDNTQTLLPDSGNVASTFIQSDNHFQQAISSPSPESSTLAPSLHINNEQQSYSESQTENLPQLQSRFASDGGSPPTQSNNNISPQFSVTSTTQTEPPSQSNSNNNSSPSYQWGNPQDQGPPPGGWERRPSYGWGPPHWGPPRGWGPRGWGPRGWGPRGWGPPHWGWSRGWGPPRHWGPPHWGPPPPHWGPPPPPHWGPPPPHGGPPPPPPHEWGPPPYGRGTARGSWGPYDNQNYTDTNNTDITYRTNERLDNDYNNPNPPLFRSERPGIPLLNNENDGSTQSQGPSFQNFFWLQVKPVTPEP